MPTFYSRLMQVAEYQGIKNTQKLSEFLGYKSPQKLYRLEKDPSAKPSFKILLDITNKFDNLDLKWLITGETDTNQKINKTSEPDGSYYRITFEEIIAEKVAEKIEPAINQIRKKVEYIQIQLDNLNEKI